MLLYRGYPIEQLAKHSSFLEVAYLLMHGELPIAAEFVRRSSNEVTHHTMMHEAFRTFLYGFRHDAHPMAMLVGVGHHARRPGMDPRGRRPLGDARPPRCRGIARYVVTDVDKDGMLQGPNLALLRDVCARTDAPVVASGGVSTLEDIVAIRGLVGDGVEGAIVGSALYKGAFTLPEALDAAGRP